MSGLTTPGDEKLAVYKEDCSFVEKKSNGTNVIYDSQNLTYHSNYSL